MVHYYKENYYIFNNKELKKWVHSIKMRPSVFGRFYKITYENRPELKHN